MPNNEIQIKEKKKDGEYTSKNKKDLLMVDR